MTCAACDNCPQDAWHLHITVTPPREWGHADIARALEQDIMRIGMHPIVITNHFRDGRKPYKELIPTKHVRGSEADASREIFRMGVALNNSGWRVKRLKIEGNANTITPGRALYYETHLKNIQGLIGRAPESRNVRGDVIHTLREHSALLVYELAVLLLGAHTTELPQPLRIEAAVLDTAPELDSEWINQ